MNTNEQGSHCQESTDHRSNRALNHEGSLNKQIRGANQSHDGGFAFTAHRGQTNSGRNEQDCGDDHDTRQAQRQASGLTQNLEQRLNDLTLVLHNGYTSRASELVANNAELLGVDQLDAERHLHHVLGRPLPQRRITVDLHEVLEGLSL